jgi:hypothetical protein
MTTLRPCTSCRRHVRQNEHACPFCGHALADWIAAATVALPVGGVSRAGLYAVVTGTAFALVACDAAPVAAYGGPPPEVPSMPVPGSVDKEVRLDAMDDQRSPAPAPSRVIVAPAPATTSSSHEPTKSWNETPVPAYGAPPPNPGSPPSSKP